MRRLCVVLGLLVWAPAARAEPQPEPPPVPPETEGAQRARTAPAAADGLQLPAADEAEAPSGMVLPQQPAAADSRGDSQLLAANATDNSLQPSAASQSAAAPATGPAPEARGRSDADALRAFPPAPPPVVPGGPPEKPNTALTSFAPAPAPAPDQPDQPAATPTPVATPAVSSAPEPAAVSGHSDVAAPAERAPEVWSAAALVGIGATFDNTLAGVNPLGFGFGVRADYRVLPDWALGARMLYFVGGSVELPSNEVAMQSWLLALEGAYALELDPISIEPGIAMGLFVRETNYRGFASFTDEPSLSVPDSTRLFFYLAPGVNVSVPLSIVTPALDPLTLGADVRLDLAFGKHVTSNIQLLLQVGLRF